MHTTTIEILASLAVLMLGVGTSFWALVANSPMGLLLGIAYLFVGFHYLESAVE